MATLITIRRDTAANWATANPILASGEIGYDLTNLQTKVGDGSTVWTALPFSVSQTYATAAAASAASASGSAATVAAVVTSTGSGGLASFVAFEALPANSWVNLFDSSGVIKMRLAIANDPTKLANGFVGAAVASGASGLFSDNGLNALTVANTSDVWLSDTTAGTMTTTRPTAPGSCSQYLGKAMKGLGVRFKGERQTQGEMVNSIARPLDIKSRHMPDLRDTGAVGLNNSGDGAFIDTLFAGVQPGQRVLGLRSGGLAAQFKRTAAAFNLNRSADLDLEHGVDLRVDNTTGQRFDALKVEVTFNDAHKGTGNLAPYYDPPYNTLPRHVDAVYPDKDPDAVGEYRGGWLRGGRIYTFNTTTNIGDALAGGYGVNISGYGKATIGLTLEKMRIGGGYGAVRVSEAGGTAGAWVQLVRCSLSNGVTFNASDGEIAVDCIMAGNNAGYSFNIKYGAFNCGVFRGTIANTDGAIDIQNGSFIKIHDVQIEHFQYLNDGASPPNPSGTSTQTYGSHLIIRGTTYTSQGIDIIGCNFGAGTNITNSVVISNARHTKIYRNQFNIASGTNPDVLLIRDASDATKDAYDTIIGYDNNFRGARSKLGLGYMTDVSRRMVISQTGGALRQQHRGMWFPLFSLLTSTASGLTDGGLECMIDHSGMIRFNGKMTRAAYFQYGMAVCTFPTWMMPFAQQSFPIMGNGGAITEGIIIASSGVLAINGSQLAACTELWLPNGAWNAVTNPGYITVP